MWKKGIKRNAKCAVQLFNPKLINFLKWKWKAVNNNIYGIFTAVRDIQSDKNLFHMLVFCSLLTQFWHTLLLCFHACVSWRFSTEQSSCLRRQTQFYVSFLSESKMRRRRISFSHSPADCLLYSVWKWFLFAFSFCRFTNFLESDEWKL